MTTINQRIQQIIDELFEGNTRAFATNTNNNYHTIRNVTGERQSTPASNVIENIANSIDYIDTDWLLTGRGEMSTNIGRDNISVGGSNSGVIGNSGTVSNVGGHNVSIAGDTNAKKIINKDGVEIELAQSAELYQQKIDSLEQRVKDLEALVQAKEEIIQMFRNK